MSLAPVSIADVQNEIQTYLADNTVPLNVADTFDLTGDGAGETVNVQDYLDALAQALLEFTTVEAFSVADANSITVAMPEGFTTAHITGFRFTNDSSPVELGVTNQTNDTGAQLTFELTGIETVDNGHRLIVRLAKPKV